MEASVGQMPISSSDAVVRPPSWQRSLPRLQPQAPLQSRGHMIDVHDVPGLAVGASVEQDPIASSELVVRPPLTHALAFLLQPQAPAQSRGHEISAQVATGLANGAGVGATDGDGDSGARDRVEMVGDTVGAALTGADVAGAPVVAVSAGLAVALKNAPPPQPQHISFGENSALPKIARQSSNLAL